MPEPTKQPNVNKTTDSVDVGVRDVNTKQTIRAAIERCLPDIPSHARPYAVEKLLEVFESYAQQRERDARIDELEMDTSQVNRIEVIDETGRAYVKGEMYGTPVSVEVSVQDDGRTLKILVTPVGAEIKGEVE